MAERRHGIEAVVPVVALLFFSTYLGIAHVWAAKTHALSYMDLLFQGDCPRVIANMTSFAHAQGRTMVHPLHVISTAPVGVVLTALLGSAEMAACAMTSAVAAVTIVVLDSIARRRFRLPLFERVMFAVLLGGSGAFATFGPVPETHVLSALGMSLMARHLSRTDPGSATLEAQGLGGWGRTAIALGFGWAVFAAGMLVTNLLAVPGYVLLQLSNRHERLRRLGSAAVFSVAVVVAVVALRGVQRALGTPREEVAAASSHGDARTGDRAEDPAAQTVPATVPPAENAGDENRGPFGRLEDRLKKELSYMGDQSFVARAAAVAASLLVLDFYVPRVRLSPYPPVPVISRAQFDYLAFDLRPAAVVGAIAWILVLGLALVPAWRRGSWRAMADEPVMLFGAGLSVFYFLVFCIYGDDLFLFSPNLVVPLMLVLTASYARAHAGATPATRIVHRTALTVAALSILVNSGSHVRDLLSPYV